MRSSRTRAALAALAFVPLAAAAQQREPVLKQITEPHDYYFREMFLPQVTTGPASATWSANGRELIFAMNGSLWRQSLGTTVATQVTWGHGYDHQPDWSPDGKRVAFARYDRDAVELELLDVESGTVTALTKNSAVNVEPRWSPDGTRLAFVTTQYDGKFTIATMPVAADGTPGAIERVTPPHDSRLPRYYYDVFDHYLSPTWSPDGKELILISNRGHIWGAGTFWRLSLADPTQMREIHDEETSWRARPDWSRDGWRVVYSSYVGRQRNGLWLMTADGGHPFELTYGDYDATNPRWSPDGSRIAYISNEGGNTSLWTIDLPGGKRTHLVQETLAYGDSTATVDIVIKDPNGSPADARIAVLTADGRSWAARDALRHGDDSFDRQERPFEIGYFHAHGRARVVTPAGKITVIVTKGLEYAVETRTETFEAGGPRKTPITIVLRRLVDLPSKGWYSGDVHVHMNYGGHYVITPKDLAFQARAEDVHVVENLIVNKEDRFPDIDWFTGKLDKVSNGETLIYSGQEFHTSYWGHTGLLGITDHIQLPGYAGYTGTAAGSIVPMNATVMELAHRQNGVAGYVHPFGEVPDPANAKTPLYDELPVDVVFGLVDYMEIDGFSDHRSTAEVWYKLLNCGFRIPAAGGTDAMTNYASLRGPVGLNRVYVRSGTLNHTKWLTALKQGKTFATNGPLLELSVNGKGIGSEIMLPNGALQRLTVKAAMRSIVAVDRVEIIVNGKVADVLPLSADGKSARGTRTITVNGSSWVTLRAWAAHSRAPVLDIYPFATTSPVYVVVGKRAQRSSSDIRYFMAWLDRLEANAEVFTEYNSPGEKEMVVEKIRAAKAEFTVRLEQAVDSGQ